jgi:phosphatidylethanolamine N-methyltransferase
MFAPHVISRPSSWEFYSYLNNPEVMSGAAFFGLAIVSGSKLVISLAIIRHLSHWWFLSEVEK